MLNEKYTVFYDSVAIFFKKTCSKFGKFKIGVDDMIANLRDRNKSKIHWKKIFPKRPLGSG